MGKFSRYEDYNKHIILCEDVPEILPYYVELPDPPPLEKFKNYGKDPMEQFYVRDKIPDKLLKMNRLPREEAFNLAMKDKECANFIAMVWDKRINGEWVFIRGIPFYLPGFYYMYLNFYHMDIGLPKFRLNDLYKAYWWKFCVVDQPRVYGGIDFSRRRIGKTFFGGNIQLEAVTRNKSFFVGNQSKTDDDVESLLHKAIVNPFRKYPFFLKPIYDPAGKMKRDIIFDDYGASGEALESWIDCRSSVDTAYDGEKLHLYFMDEAGKMKKPTDPVKMWDKVKPCLIEDDKIIGKALIDTTVEEMEKGGLERFLELWMDSSRKPEDNKINELGETLSGLVPHFIPSYKCFIWDRFGFPIIENPTGYQLTDRERQSTEADIERGLHKLGAKELLDLKFRSIKDSRKRYSEIRKFPRTVTEAFASSNTHCHFNSAILNDRLGFYLFEPEKGKVRGNFEWEDGNRFGNVVFRPRPDGRWLVSYYPSQDKANQMLNNGGRAKPANFDKFVIGCDTFKYSVTTSNKPSRGAFYVWAYFDAAVEGDKDEADWTTDDFVCEYLYRPSTVDLFAEDVLMTAKYYGCKVNPENNANIIWQKFEDWGFGGYLHYGKKIVKKDGRTQIEENKTPGATTLGNAMKDSMFASVDWYVETHGHRCKFPNSMKCYLEVQYDNMTPHDAFVGSAYTLMPVRELKQRPKVEIKSFQSFAKKNYY